MPTPDIIENRREQTRERRRQAFLFAGEKLFGEKGYHATTMEDIANHAEFATGTIYRYFGSKEELYSQILNNKLDELFLATENNDKPELPPRERLRNYVRGRFEFCRTHKNFLSIYTNEVLAPTAQITAKLNDTSLEKHEKCMELLEKIYAAGIETEDFKPYPPKLYVTGLYGFINELFLKNFRNATPLHLDELENFAIDMIEGATLKP